MKKLILLTSMLFFTINIAKASEWKFWKVPGKQTRSMDILSDTKEFQFTNRAACAVEASRPADSFFILVNNMDLGRSLYRLAQRTGRETNEFTRMGIQVFRYTVIQLMEHIHLLMAQKRLPLLPVDLETWWAPHRYQQILKSCRSDEVCQDLDSYLEKLWTIAHQNMEQSHYKQALLEMDNFQISRSFLSSDVFEKSDGSFHSPRCQYLKKFSPLQSTLFGTKPTDKALEQMAQVLMQAEHSVSACDDWQAQEHLGLATYQIDLPVDNAGKWEDQGFEYWNTLRLYFAWAWRKAGILDQMAHPFADVFRGVAVEEAVMFVPHGCRSLMPAKCDSDYLGQNIIREFAKQAFRKNGYEDVLRELPNGPEWDLIEKPITEVNTDILNLAQHENAIKWLDNFQKNYASTRGLMKKKLIKSISTLNILTGKLSTNDLYQGLENYFRPVLGLAEYPIKSEQADALKQELYYLCSEYYFSHHQDFHIIREDLSLVGKSGIVDAIAYGLAQQQAQAFYQYFDTIGKGVIKLCDQVQQNQIWGEGFTIKREGFAPWYLEKMFEKKYKSNYNQQSLNYLQYHVPVLAWSGYQESGKLEDVFCASPAHCARELLSSMVALYSVTVYASTFWGLQQKMQSPALFNPYAERTACGVYDPWFKTRSLLFSFFSNMAQAALSTVAPGLIYTAFELEPGRVTSFRRLVEEGKIVFDPKGDPERINAALMADFGPLLGVPCAVSIANTEHQAANYYRFSGISVAACRGERDYDLNVSSAEDLHNMRRPGGSACFSCGLHFEAVASSLTRFASNIGPTYFMVRGLVKLFQGLQDPHDIPRSWKVNPEYLIETYRRFGTIPKRCTGPLSHGGLCLENKCEENIVKLVKDKARGQIQAVQIPIMRRVAYVEMDTCKEPLKVKFETEQRHFHDQCEALEVKIPDSCKEIKYE